LVLNEELHQFLGKGWQFLQIAQAYFQLALGPLVA